MTSPPNPRLWTKTIPPARDRLQSRLLVWITIPVLCSVTVSTLLIVVRQDKHFIGYAGRHDLYFRSAIPVSLFFALVTWSLRAATPAAAICGGMVCLLVTALSFNPGSSIVASGLTPLILLFVLTFQATRMGRHRKMAIGLAESRKGRNAAQVIANLGIAAFFGSIQGMGIVDRAQGSWTWIGDSHVFFALFSIPMLAALAEATADTVSSEIGQAFGGPPFMLTTLRRVPVGTDGAVTLAGTFAGIAAAAIVVASAIPAMGMPYEHCLVAFAAAIFGLFFDSFLGATLERRGWIGNDLVNLFSTAFAAGVSLTAIHFLRSWLLRLPSTN